MSKKIEVHTPVRTAAQVRRLRRGCKRPTDSISNFALYQRKRREGIRRDLRKIGLPDIYVN
jgi:hypothetical protein